MKVFKNVWKLTITIYNQQIYLAGIKTLHVIAYEWKPIDIVISSIFFLWEFEELESCKFRVETAKAGMVL